MKSMEKIWDTLGEILAVILVVAYAVLILNATLQFITNETVLFILDILRNYGTLALIGVVGMEAMCKRCLALKIVFFVFCSVIVVFLFFPATYDNFIGTLVR